MPDSTPSQRKKIDMWRNYEIQTVFIKTVIEGLEAGEIAIPAFQRDLCWSDDQKLDFLNSIVRDDVPPGMIYSWSRWSGFERDGDGFSFKDFAWQKKLDSVEDLVLDGQHRLVTIAEAFIEKRFLWDVKERSFVLATDSNRDALYCYDPMALVSGIVLTRVLDQKYPRLSGIDDFKFEESLRQAQDIRFGWMFIKYPDIDSVLNVYQKIAWGGSPASIDDFSQFVEARKAIMEAKKEA